ncbi:hypothetical protein BG004_007134, partial [Podila humilis]
MPPILSNSIASQDSTSSTTAASTDSKALPTPTPALKRLQIDSTKRVLELRSHNNNDVISSPNQLQGVVVESLKTPIKQKQDYSSPFRSKGASDSISILNDVKASGAFEGDAVFEPETSGSSENSFAWMFRQRSKSVGTIPSTTGDVVAAAATAATTTTTTTLPMGGFRHLRALSGQNDVARVTAPVAGAAATVSSSQSLLFDKLRSLVNGSSSTLSSTDGLDHGVNSLNHNNYSHDQEQDQMIPYTSRFKQWLSQDSSKKSPSSVLAVSTASLSTAARATWEMDGEHSMHLFNHNHHDHNLQQQGQQQQFQNTLGKLSASSPASTLSYISHMPPLSTTTTNTSTYSCSCASTATSTTTASYPPSVYSTSGSSTTSTLCHHHHSPNPDVHHHHDNQSHPDPGTPQRKERSRRIGLRKFIHWTIPHGAEQQQQQQPYTPGIPLEHENETNPIHTTTVSSTTSTTATATGLRGSNSAFFQSREGRPSLKELSGRKTRYFDKNGALITSMHPVPSGSKSYSNMPRCSRHHGPKRVDAKALFSNERTYMHWIKFGLLLGAMALNLISFSQSAGLQVGLFLVLVAMSTLVYATATFHLRHVWMARMRNDVLYYDRYGPSLLFAALFFAYATNVV